MKNLTSFLLIFALTAAVFTGCASTPDAPAGSQAAASSAEPAASPTTEPSAEEPAESTQTSIPTAQHEITLAGLKGPTTMGLVKLLSDSESGIAANKYQYTMAAAADEITPKLVKGELDIAAVPANLASVLYNNTKGEIQLLAVNTLGVIYLCEKSGTVKSLSDLKGKTIYATGKGSTPEYTLKYLLNKNGLDPEQDVTIEWKSEPTEVVAMMTKSADAVAMLPQPFVTVALSQVKGLKIAANLGEEWQKLGSELVTGVIVARKDYVKNNPEAVASFLTEYQASTAWVNANAADAAKLIEQYGIVKAPIAEKALPLCNITYMAGAEMKTAVSSYLQILMDQNPKAIGGALPGDDFYYEG